jgi:hypothetical protein
MPLLFLPLFAAAFFILPNQQPVFLTHLLLPQGDNNFDLILAYIKGGFMSRNKVPDRAVAVHMINAIDANQV